MRNDHFAAWVRPVLLVVAVCLVFVNFDIGFRVTADQIEDSNFVFTHPLSEIVSHDIAAAVAQGRIGHLIVLPLTSLGSYVGDAVLYPVLCVAIFFVTIYSIFRWVELIAVGRLALPLTCGYLAFLPLGLNHWLPNSYPMQLLPLALGLVARNRLLARSDLGTLQRMALLFVVLIAAVSYEIALFVLLAITITDVAAALTAPKQSEMLGLDKRFVLSQIVVLSIALAANLGFRLIFPSSYEGNTPANIARLGDAVLTAIHHLAKSSSIDLIWRGWSEQSFSTSTVAYASIVAAGLAVGAAGLRWLERRRALVLAAGGAMIAAMVTLAVGSVSKYIDWCLKFGECRYIDSRFALSGLIIAAVALAVFFLGDRATRSLLVVVVTCAAFLTTCYNLGQRSKLDFGRRAEDIAKRFVCDNAHPRADPRDVAERLAKLPVSFHPHHTTASKVDHWVAYIEHLRTTSLWRCP